MRPVRVRRIAVLAALLGLGWAWSCGVPNFEFASDAEPDHCRSGQQDGDESDTDCGGSCRPCGVTRSCREDDDCLTGYCSRDRCREDDGAAGSSGQAGEAGSAGHATAAGDAGDSGEGGTTGGEGGTTGGEGGTSSAGKAGGSSDAGASVADGGTGSAGETGSGGQGGTVSAAGGETAAGGEGGSMADGGEPAAGGTMSSAGEASSAGSGAVAAGGSGAGGSTAGQGGSAAGNGGSSGTGGTAGVAGTGGQPDDGILFFDDFESGADGMWSPNAAQDFSVVDLGNNWVYRQNNSADVLRVSVAGDAAWTDVAVEAKVRVLSFGGTSTSDLAAIYLRYQDTNNHYYLALRSDGKLAIRRKIAGANTTIGGSFTAPVTLVENSWYTLKIEAIGSELNAYFDANLLYSVSDTMLAAGRIGVGTDNATAEFDDVLVTEP